MLVGHTNLLAAAAAQAAAESVVAVDHSSYNNRVADMTNCKS